MVIRCEMFIYWWSYAVISITFPDFNHIFFRFADESAPESTHSQLMQIASLRFKEAKASMVMRFSGDNQSDMTLVVWDFGGQKVGASTIGYEK